MLKFFLVNFFSFFFFIFHLLTSYLLLVNFNLAWFMELKIFSFFNFSINLEISIDWMSLLFSSVVFFISFVVFSYMNFYMGNMYSMERFLKMTFLFIASMVVLIYSSSMFFMLLGWDGLGVVSFCLVIFYEEKESLISGMMTILINRIGDVIFIILFYNFLMFSNMNYNSLVFMDSFVMIMFIIGAMTKSAQYPFLVWLPAAMSAPTPISSLVHSSTLVTAGIYVTNRLFTSMNFSYSWYFTVFSLLTMLISGFCAISEYDLKKIIAMSTLSQLGMMFFSLSVGLYKVSFFHMICHAMFKSLMFLSAGSFISFFGGGQDMRIMSKGVEYNFFFFICLISSMLSLMGMPFLTGFYSKDAILEFSSSYLFGVWVFIIFWISCAFSCFYTIRTILILFNLINQKMTSLLNFNFSLSSLLVCGLAAYSVIFGNKIFYICFHSNLTIIYLSLKSLGLLIFLTSIISYPMVNFLKLFFELSYNMMGMKVLFFNISSLAYNMTKVVMMFDFMMNEFFLLKKPQEFIFNFGNKNVMVDVVGLIYWIPLILFFMIILFFS